MTQDDAIIGGRELDQLLQTLPVKMEKNIMRGALRAGTAVLLPEVWSRIPYDSGALLRSARITTRGRNGSVSASVKVGNREAWYAHLVEFGTRSHFERARSRNGAMRFNGIEVREVNHPGTRPQPFFRPAFDAVYPDMLKAVTKKVRQRLTRQGINAPEPLPADPQE